jgi:hypothetical protein
MVEDESGGAHRKAAEIISEAMAGAAGAAFLQPAKRTVVRVNKLTRQRWCFRRALVRALLLVQQQQLAGAVRDKVKQQQQQQQQQQKPDVAGETVLPSMAPAGGRRQPKRGARAKQAAAGTPAPASAGAGWQAGFDPAAVTAEQLSAAGDALSGPSRAAAAAAAAEGAVDALAAVRRSKRSQAGDKSEKAGTAGSQRAAARPPQILKQHVPCTDTTKVGCSHRLKQAGKQKATELVVEGVPV